MGEFGTVVFGPDVRPEALNRVLQEWGALRQDMMKQWYVFRHVPLGGFWLWDQDPSPEEVLDDAEMAESERLLGGRPRAAYTIRLCKLEDSHLVAAAFAHRCGLQWPCLYVNSWGNVLSPDDLAHRAGEPPDIHIDLALAARVPPTELLRLVRQIPGAEPVALVGPWDWPGPQTRVAVAPMEPDYAEFDPSTSDEAGAALGSPVQQVVRLWIQAGHDGAGLALSLTSLIAAHCNTVAVLRATEEVLPIPAWQSGFRTWWTWG